MILSDKQILKEMRQGNIVIEPFDRKNLGSNSYDVHLDEWMAAYNDKILDARKHNKIRYFKIPRSGFVLKPGKFYLGVSEEYTETHKHVPFLEGKSSIGRLGIDIHATAGKGDVGFCNTWTMEISTHKPVRIYAGMSIGQLIYFKVSGKVEVSYHLKKSAKYAKHSLKPVESMMWKNF
ncbi:MAG TPA: dCTP deaminase [Candidatus Paceibacterota bacterium]